MHPVRNTLVPVQDVISRDPLLVDGPSVTDAVTVRLDLNEGLANGLST